MIRTSVATLGIDLGKPLSGNACLADLTGRRSCTCQLDELTEKLH